MPEPVETLGFETARHYGVKLVENLMEDAKTIPRAIRLILIARFLERVADHATNIAEMVIYMVDSKMVRHTLA